MLTQKARGIITLFLLVTVSIALGCDSDGGSKGQRINVAGSVLSVDGNEDDVVGITIDAIDSNSGDRLGSTTTGLLGQYNLRVKLGRNQTRLVDLVFTTPDLPPDVFTGSFIITKSSSVLLDVELEGDGDVVIPFNFGDCGGFCYTVLSEPIRTSGGQVFQFDNAAFGGLSTPGTAQFIIAGNGRDCVRAIDQSSVILGPDQFSAADCAIGLRSENNALISVEAGTFFDIVSRDSGIRSRETSSVDATTDDDGEFNILSTNGFGIRCSGQSDVTAALSPTIACSIDGASGDISEETFNCSIEVGAGCLAP